MALTLSTTASSSTTTTGKRGLRESSVNNNNKNGTMIPLVFLGSLVIHMVLFLLESSSNTSRVTNQLYHYGTSSLPSFTGFDTAAAAAEADAGTQSQQHSVHLKDEDTTTRIPNSHQTQTNHQGEGEDSIINSLQDHQHQQQFPPPTVNIRPPTLEEVVAVSGVTSCRPEDMSNNPKTQREDFQFLESTMLKNQNKTHPPNRKIPKIIHVTSKSKCMHKNFVDNLDKWRHFSDYEFYVHDDGALEYLLGHPYFQSVFPMLSKIQPCVLSGAMKSDLWRLLVLWQYGGLYTDIDNAPGKRFYKYHVVDQQQQQQQQGSNSGDSYYNDTMIEDDDDAWFVVERIGVPSQYFMASSPKHPLLYVALMVTIKNILIIPSLKSTYVAQISGPTALKEASIIFLGQHQHSIKDMDLNKRGGDRNMWMGTRGTYVGIQNRTVKVVGTAATTNDYIHRESIHPFAKREAYVAMGMKHFTWAHNGRKNLKGWPGGRIKPLEAKEWNISCIEHLYKTHEA